MKICFYKSNSLLVGGGAENLIIELSKRLAENHQVIIATLNQLPDARLKLEDVRASLKNVHCIELPSYKFPRGVALPTLSGLKLLIREMQAADVTYVILPASPADLLFGILSMITSRVVVAGIHGFLRTDVLLQEIYLPIFTKTLHHFKALHVTNKVTYDWLLKERFNNVHLIPNGVDSNKFELSTKSIDSETFNILFTGRLSEEKGADVLIDIIHYLNGKFDMLDLKFSIAGSGELAPTIKELEKLYTNVYYLGFASPDELPSIYDSAHIYLIPSRMEGMPLRLLEAQSCGLPCVGTKIPGISDIVVENKTGHLVDLHDIEAFANAIIEYYNLWLDSRENYHLLKRQIRDETAKKYDWKKAVTHFEKMIQTSLG